jgi:hypothetical protein
MSKSAFRFDTAAILLASWLAVLGTSAANAGGARAGVIGTTAHGSSEGSADSSAGTAASGGDR